VIAGVVGAVLWLAASGWSKANYDLHRQQRDCVTLDGASLTGPGHAGCVTLIFANAKSVVFIDDRKVVFLERRKDSVLKAYRCPPKVACPEAAAGKS
jgi:hypothetical protein